MTDGADVVREVDVVAFDVERGKVREFARATMAADPAHTERAVARERGQPDVVATATYVAVSLHYRDQREWVAGLGLDIERTVVGSVRWTYRRPMVVGDTIVGRRRVMADERRPGTGGELRLVTLETDFVDATGETVVTQQDVIVERPAT